MRRRLAYLLVAAALMGAVATGTAADPAGADESASEDVFGMTLDEFLSHYPDARPLGGGAYELEPGVRLVPPSSSANDVGILEAPSGCSDNWFCVYNDADFRGYHYDQYYCGRRSLPPEAANRVSSMHNAQNSYTAFFWDGGLQGALGPNRYLRNLARDTAPDGNSWNDRIETIQAC